MNPHDPDDDLDLDLRAALARLDPARGVPVTPANGRLAAELREHLMSTDSTPSSPPRPAAGPDTDTVLPFHPADGAGRRPSRRLAAWAGAAAAVIAVAVALAVGLTHTTRTTKAATSVTFALGAPSPGRMCVNIDSLQPDPSMGGFRGTVTSVTDTAVELKVTQWYRGGTADDVVITVPQGVDPELAGPKFTVGADVLVAEQDGTVQGCGLSGDYSADLAARYQTWFG